MRGHVSAFRTHELQQYAVLLGCEFDERAPVVAEHEPACGIEGDVAAREHGCGRVAGPAAPLQGADTGQQFGIGERFGQVIVGP